jgi:ABC-type transporter Mla subunit MlaD
MRSAVQNINGTFTRLNEDALSSTNMQNLKASIEHLSQTTDALAQSSKKLDSVVDKADATMSSTKKAADDLQKVVQAATQGKGLLAALLTNQELANDLRALISNLRAHGVLFYRDSAAKIDMNAREQPKPRQTGGRR